MDRTDMHRFAQLDSQGNLQEMPVTFVRSYRRAVRRGLPRVVYVRPYRRRR